MKEVTTYVVICICHGTGGQHMREGASLMLGTFLATMLSSALKQIV
jgi:hypothetical protein